ncbi:hypothetical protein PLANPX_4072 [Lacipirellula parvula]|uniref:Uncharacterized protein n=1 Tax=Lacipirellula parvula TaxID=2650471 RepID=A0A5K7XCB1_9BACT|nr:hypothetical protein PLANPX_4072 [Lacipirellula parvula]
MIRALLILVVFASTAHAQRPMMRQVPAVKQHYCAPTTVVVIVVKQRRPIIYYGGGWYPPN